MPTVLLCAMPTRSDSISRRGHVHLCKRQTNSRVAAEFYINAINVMSGAEAFLNILHLPRQEAFNIEYWLLEEAKLQRMPKPKA